MDFVKKIKKIPSNFLSRVTKHKTFFIVEVCRCIKRIFFSFEKIKSYFDDLVSLYRILQEDFKITKMTNIEGNTTCIQNIPIR